MNINYFIPQNIVHFSLATFMHYTNLCLCSSELDPKWTEKTLISASERWDFIIHSMPHARGVASLTSWLVAVLYPLTLPLPSSSLLSERTSVSVWAAVWVVDLNSRRKQHIAHLQKQVLGMSSAHHESGWEDTVCMHHANTDPWSQVSEKDRAVYESAVCSGHGSAQVQKTVRGCFLDGAQRR